MDFTLTTYQKLLNTLKNQGYTFQPFADAIEKPRANTIILRHDVDLHPENVLQTAKIEQSLGIGSTYFFRIIPETFKTGIIQQIANLRHEIGYHYEDMTLVAGEEVSSRKYEVQTHGRASVKNGRDAIHRVLNAIKSKTNKSSTCAVSLPGSCRGKRGKRGEKTEKKNILIDHTYQLFRHHLEQLRQYEDIKTICVFNEFFILQGKCSKINKPN
ncbi:MAG: hypothetical protein ACOC90_09480 [Bacteroidota bacterium]